jgi:hypothetical protein
VCERENDRNDETVRAVEVRTNRLVLEDDDGTPRAVAEVTEGVTEIRIDLPSPSPDRGTAVVLFASPSGGAADRYGLGPAIGVQLWADGQPVAELDAWPDEDGRWRAHLHINGG